MGVSAVARTSAGSLSSPPFDGLKLGAGPILAVHDEIAVECEETEATVVEIWLMKAMIDGMEEVINAPDPERSGVPVKVEARRARTWG